MAVSNPNITKANKGREGKAQHISPSTQYFGKTPLAGFIDD
jgi:hypothetical protein